MCCASWAPAEIDAVWEPQQTLFIAEATVCAVGVWSDLPGLAGNLELLKRQLANTSAP